MCGIAECLLGLAGLLTGSPFSFVHLVKGSVTAAVHADANARLSRELLERSRHRQARQARRLPVPQIVHPTEGAPPSQRLLNDAALLENTDLVSAVALYERVLVQYPGTRAAAQAESHLQSLWAAHPRLT